VNYEYEYNVANEVIHYKVLDDSLIYNGYYNASTLYKTIVTDEIGNIAVEYKNKSGQLVLAANKPDTVYLKTHYVYDDMGQLRYVLSPKAVENTGIINYAQTSNRCVTLFL
jgi:hypothetical protein